MLAHALPLLLGPALTRLYAPADFGQYALLWAVATNLAVVACARYEFALPLEKIPPARRAADGPVRPPAAGRHGSVHRRGPGAPLLARHGPGLAAAAGVLAIGATQWLTLWATRSQRFGLLSAARLVQQGGGAVLQVLLGLFKAGPVGLLLGPIVAGLGAAWLLARPAPQGGWLRLVRQPLPRLKAMAARHRDFPLYNTPHAFIGALQDTLTLLLIAAWAGDAAAGFWALALRYLKAPATLLGGALSQALYPQLLQARSARRGAGAGAPQPCWRWPPWPRPWPPCCCCGAPPCSPGFLARSGATPERWRADWACTSACTSLPRRCRWSRWPGGPSPGRCGWRWSGRWCFSPDSGRACTGAGSKARPGAYRPPWWRTSLYYF